MKIEVRLAKLEDLEQLEELRRQFIEDQLASGLLEIPAEIEAHVRSSTAGLIRSARSLVLVAIQEGLLKGYLTALYKTMPGTTKPNVHSIEELFVTESARRQKIGDKLFLEAIAAISENSVDRIQVRVLARNLRALSFWRSHGFGENVMILEYKQLRSK